MEPGFNCSDLCDGNPAFGSQEQQQRTLRELCAITVTSSDRSGKSSPSFSAALLGVVWTFLTGGVLLALFFLAFTIRFRKNRIVKMSSPNLNVVTLLGSGLTYTSAYLFGVQEQSLPSRDSVETLIQVRLCLLCVGTSLVLGPVLGKSWRLYRVFTQRVPDKRVIIKDLQLLSMVAALVLADAVLLLTWVFSDPVQCFRSLSVSVRATEKGMTCSVSRMQSCASLYSDLWLVLILGFKSVLLLYGTYLAGLTDNVSSPPVNQSLTLVVGVNLIFLVAGAVFLVHRFFRAWHNLLFGFTSGGIFVCTTTINCFIFVPQLRQWKAFEEESQTLSHMAKYFTSPSRSCHSVYSEEQLYQLIGEKNSMKRLLTEKNAVIESLQEQVNNAKEKLMRLMSAEGGCDPAVLAPCTRSTGRHGQQHGCAAASGDVPGDHSPPDPEQDGQQRPQLPRASPHSPVPFSGDAQYLWKQMSHEHVLPEEPDCSPALLFDMGDNPEHSPKDAQEHGMPAGKGHPLELGQDLSAAASRERPPKVSYVSSEKLQEILQDLSLDGRTCNPAFPARGVGMWGAQEGYPATRNPLSPYLTRRRRHVPLPPASTGFPVSPSPRARCVASSAVSRTGTWGCGEPARLAVRREGEGAGGGLHYPAPSSASIPTEGWPEPQGWEASGMGPEIHHDASPRGWRQQGAPGMPARPALHSLYHYPDSDSSSSSEEMFPCCHRPCCQACLRSPHGSLGSSSSSTDTDTDTEPGGAVGRWLEPQSRAQAVVNFKEDLKPTFV
ncbi:probable G-protein coupled receptor 156 isoform X2 [Oxyura jamaicensis]|uniref:probable G-protein coupled receptor 156 isoform X2 n=1 Tax=Oxyura jamaicensis TaxID=8884 RepID=UPI0015A56C03|nr:probable G-protein coupled receptor 156 isoform X2 [Oxyura jamaicensis]